MCYNARDPWKALKNAMAGGHESVLEHCKFSFQIEGVSRALLAQLTRHRIASFSVQSQRYVSYENGFDYVTPPSILALGAEAEKRYHTQMEMMHMWYCEWLKNDVTPEDARFVLPNACTTKLVVTMNARELRHFFSLRCCNRAQWEIRQMADEMLKICKEEAYSLFADAGAGCVRGACPEGKHSCGKPRNKEQVNV
jgi:thymidylate synthase (FAD)